MQQNEALIQKLASSAEGISNSLVQIESLLSRLMPAQEVITLNQSFYGLFVVFVGALSAYLFNYFHWKMVSKKNKLLGLCTAFTILINELERVSVLYWLTPYQRASQREAHTLEIQIKSNRQLISRYIKSISLQLSGKQYDPVKKKLNDFDQEMFDLITGDGFESQSREISKSKAAQISKRCVSIKAAVIML
ncbi:hypothetical protein [Cycloclasticus sp.]|uniref:hypothetical protein n=1 Tax=Cycloclasticus sp. TaxID=2024830 RepID=UPI00257CAB4B|nr:hypothetical protein [Cycloclasticus sp.]